MTTHLDAQTIFARLKASPADIQAFCHRWNITELALFGSILRDDFDEQYSDVDILATFDPAHYRGLAQAIQMKDELESICQRKVDIISRSAIERSPNWITKHEIFNSMQVIYVSQS